MRSRSLYALLFLAIGGCTAADQSIAKIFNESEFTGLRSIGRTYEQIELDYELDDLRNKTIKFKNCQQVDKFNKEEILVSQYRLFTLLQINCAAAKYYHSGNVAHHSFFPERLSLDLVKLFPAVAVPVTSKENIAKRQNSLLGNYDKKIKIKTMDSAGVTVITGDGEELSYLAMARVDVDNDSIEDIVLRLDWSVPNSFGQGFDLLVLSKTSVASPIKLLWRYIY